MVSLGAKRIQRLVLAGCSIVAGLVTLLYSIAPGYAAQITDRSMVIGSNQPSDTAVNYVFQFAIPTAGSMNSINIEFCSNSALVEDICQSPDGFDASSAAITSQSGLAGFVKSSSGSTANNILLTHSPGNVQPAGSVTVTFSGLTNPSAAGSYYAKIFTYTTSDGSGAYTDFGALAFAILPGFDVSAEVPPFLTFCQGTAISNFDCTTANGNQLDLGQLSSAVSSTATSQLLASTNAANGYQISVSGITMTSGNNILPALANQPAQAGTSQFGLNLRSNTVPLIGQEPAGSGTGTPATGYATVNRFRFRSGEVIAHAANAQDFRKYTISYVVDVAKDQAPGVYSTTLTYVCTGNF